MYEHGGENTHMGIVPEIKKNKIQLVKSVSRENFEARKKLRRKARSESDVA